MINEYCISLKIREKYNIKLRKELKRFMTDN